MAPSISWSVTFASISSPARCASSHGDLRLEEESHPTKKSCSCITEFIYTLYSRQGDSGWGLGALGCRLSAQRNCRVRDLEAPADFPKPPCKFNLRPWRRPLSPPASPPPFPQKLAGKPGPLTSALQPTRWAREQPL